MKRSSLARSIIFALAAAVLAAGAGTARAAVILLDVSGSLSDKDVMNPPADACGSGCALGGFIVIGNATNAVFAVHVTVSDPGNSFDLDQFEGINASGGNTEFDTDSSGFPFDLDFFFSTPTAGSLNGFTGGPLLAAQGNAPDGNEFALISGSLTEGTGVPSVPEPSSLVLMLTAIAGVSTTLLVKRLLSERTA
jgi:hypothetical protein